MDECKVEMEAALHVDRQFVNSCAETLNWLSGKLGNLSKQFLVSAEKSTLQQQINSHAPIYREIMIREQEIITLLDKGKELQVRPGSLSHDRTLQSDLHKIKEQWERVKREISERHMRLHTSMKHCTKYSAAFETFFARLRSAERELAAPRLGNLKKSQMKYLQAFRSEVFKCYFDEYERTKDFSETFLASCNIDKEPLKAELQAMKERWEKLSLIFDLAELECTIDGLASPGRETKVVRDQLNHLARVLEKLNKAADNVAKVESARKQLVDAGFLSDIMPTQNEISELRQTIYRVENHANNREKILREIFKALNDFYDEYKKADDDVTKLGDKMCDLNPVRSELVEISNQQAYLRQLRDETVETLTEIVDKMNRMGQYLVRTARSGVSTAVLESDLDKLNEKLNSNKQSINLRQRKLDLTRLQLQLSKWLKEKENKEEPSDFSDPEDIAKQLMNLIGEDADADLGEEVRSLIVHYTNLVKASDKSCEALRPRPEYEKIIISSDDEDEKNKMPEYIFIIDTNVLMDRLEQIKKLVLFGKVW